MIHSFFARFLFFFSSKGYCYCRAGNPTRTILEKSIAALDNAKYCLTFPSGCATLTTLLQRLKPGDHILSASETYGGTRTLFLHYAKTQQIEVDFVDITCVDSVEEAIKPNTKVCTRLIFHLKKQIANIFSVLLIFQYFFFCHI